jgi:ElaB/YqjD/DUF883 family membrane-anchored ribosome-binding protein
MSQQSDFNNGRGGALEPRPTPSTQPKSPEQLREEIARTRSALSQDVAALGERLSPENLKESAKDLLHDATDAAKEGAKGVFRDAKDAAVESLRHAKDHAIDSISETYHEVSERVQSAGSSTALFVSTHAIPLSLVGLGLGWLALSMGHARRQQLREYGGDYDYASGAGGYELGGEGMGGRARQAVHSAREHAGELATRATDALSNRGEQLRGRADEMRSQIVHRAADVRRRTVDMGHRAYEGIGHAGARARDLGSENPLTVGLLVLAAGVGLGMMLPSTRRENRLFGETRDRLARDARRTASELGRSVRRGADELREALSEE